jgi:hypothetical protein
MECKGLKYTGINDPAKLVAAGIPVPPAPIFLQGEFPLSDLAQDIDCDPEGCTLISSMKLAKAFEHFSGLIQGKGFRQTRKPYIGDSLNSTDFKKDSARLKLNVYLHEAGSRIVLKYEDPRGQTSVPPLPPVEALSMGKSGRGDKRVGTKQPARPDAKQSIDVTANKGSVTVTCEGKKYTFSNVAGYQEKGSPSYTTIVFSSRPIPYDRIQAGVSKKLDFSFDELYDFDSPNYFTLRLGPSASFSLSVPGVGVGRGIEKSVNEMKIEAGRVRGTFKMLPDDDDDWRVSFTATIDAAIITPNTHIAGPSAPVE